MHIDMMPLWLDKALLHLMLTATSQEVMPETEAAAKVMV